MVRARFRGVAFSSWSSCRSVQVTARDLLEVAEADEVVLSGDTA